MQTFSGRQYWPLDPRPEDVEIRDIAHHLSLLCRYTGACRRFYSVAEHSYLVSLCVPVEFAFQGLMHDAPEAYCNDIARPLKPDLANYEAIEDANWRAVCAKFGLPYELDASVKAADNACLMAEAKVLLAPHPAPWGYPDITPADVQIQCLEPYLAEQLFLRRFRQLYKEGAA